MNSLPLKTTIVNNTTYYATQTVGAYDSTNFLAVLAYNESLAAGQAGSSANSLKVYPNPVTDILNFTGTQKVSRIILFTADGRIVSERKLNGERKINVSSWVQSIYIMQVIT